jgi:putative tricarboxylic transport membrane protein
LALILGPMLESEMIRTKLMFHGNYLLFYTRPIAALLLVMSVIMFFWPWIAKGIAGRRTTKVHV